MSVAHACNPSYSGGRGQPGQIVLKTLSRKNASEKRADGVAQGVGQVQAPVPPKKKKKKNAETYLSISCGDPY
jgi:hypothetical protein